MMETDLWQIDAQIPEQRKFDRETGMFDVLSNSPFLY